MSELEQEHEPKPLICARVTTDLERRIKAAAAKDDRPVASWVRRVLTDAVAGTQHQEANP